MSRLKSLPFTSNDSIDGGAGTGDRLVLNEDTIFSGDFGNTSHIETLKLSGNTTRTVNLSDAVVASSDNSARLAVDFSDATTATVSFSASSVTTGHSVNVTGGNGAATLTGGSGDDTLTGGSGVDVISGGNGNDTLNGGSGSSNDSCNGGSGNDTIAATLGNDTLDGGAGTDILRMQATDLTTNDYVIGNTEADTLEIVTDSDTLTASDFTHVSTIETVKFLANVSGHNVSVDSNVINASDNDEMTFDFSAVTSSTITFDGSGVTGTAYNMTILGGEYDDPDDENSTVIGGADTIVGGNAADTIEGGVGNDSINGGGDADYILGEVGRDWISGDYSDDTIYGGDGNDTLGGETGVDSLYGENGKDSLLGGTNNDTLDGGENDDYVSGGDNNDTLYGRNGVDDLRGGLGNDILDGGAEADRLQGDDTVGAAGADTFVIYLVTDSTTSARDRIVDFNQGTDKIDLSNLDYTGISSAPASGTVLNFTYNGGTDRTYVSDTGSFSFFLDGNYTLAGSDFLF